jgi:thermitase
LFGFLCLALPTAAVASPANPSETNSLSWRVQQNRVDADIQKWELPRLLSKISSAAGWQVYVEPGTTQSISAKFKNVTQDEALQRLLGKLNYFTEETNGVTRLKVWRTVRTAATQIVKAESKKDHRIPNELLVQLKRGSTNSIEELAKKLGAKIIGRDDKLGFYRLQFADGTTTDAAMQALASDPSVGAVGSNYYVDPPSPVQMAQVGQATAGAALNLNPPDGKGQIIGLIDTAVYPPDQLQKYMLTPINVTGQPDPQTDQPTHGTSMFETVLNAMSTDPSMIQPVVIYGNQDATTDYELVEGLTAAVNSGAKLISISSGGSDNSPLVASAIAQIIQMGIPIIAAAGNTPGTEPTYPGAYPGVLAVTASGPNGQLASWADDGSFVRAMEPGTAMVVYNGGLWQVEGTSPATATAAGSIMGLANQNQISLAQAAALVIQKNPAPK